MLYIYLLLLSLSQAHLYAPITFLRRMPRQMLPREGLRLTRDAAYRRMPPSGDRRLRLFKRYFLFWPSLYVRED